VGFVSYSHGRIGWFLPGKTAVSAAGLNPSPSLRGSAQAASAPIRVSSPNATTVDAPPLPTAPPSPPSVDTPALTDDEPKTVKVTVRPGETLQQIALRTLGQDDSQILKEIQQLNPRLTNPDHIEADQQIRLPQISKASNPPSVAGATDLSRKN
jgi:nucleoid-associated protein YgaU